MTFDSETSLARRLGTTTHVSPLLQKASRLGVRDAGDLEAVARSRGLRYFGESMHQSDRARPMLAEDPALFSNEELAIALINPASPYSFNRIRMAGAVMAAKGVSAETLAHLARQERCEAVVRHIATCGRTAEPSNPLWTSLLDQLPTAPPAATDLLPQLSRFVAMAGLTRQGKQVSMQWVRPIP
jgi:hypothetical protein